MSYTIALQILSTSAPARRIMQGLVDFKRTRSDWIYRLRPFWDKQNPSTVPHVDAVVMLPFVNGKWEYPGFPDKRVYISSRSTPPAYPRVSPDNYAVGALAAEHFLRAGFTRLAVYNPAHGEHADERERGFADTAGTRGHVITPFTVVRDFHESDDDWQHSLRTWLRGLPKPVGIFCINDESALNVANACEFLGFDIPHQVSLLGVDNDELVCESCPVPLSSIDHGTHQMGWKAGELLADWLDTGRRPAADIVHIQPVGLIVRASSDVLAVGEAHLAKALRFLRENACNGIGAEDVIRASGLNRRALERRFRQHLQTTILHEIQMARLDEVRRRLSATRDPITLIADECGFASQTELSHIFKRYIGSAPSTYRKEHYSPRHPEQWIGDAAASPQE
jgi:LacI family transcriptional regulator